MAQPIIQPSFASGEFSPALFGRVDLAKFHSGAALLRNFFVDYRGGAANRAGTRYVGPCLAGINRLIPFSFSTLQTYALVFSDRAMRVVMNGGLVLEPALNITGASQANPCVLNVVNALTPTDWVFVQGVQGMTQLNGKFFIVGATTPGTIQLFDLNFNPIDSSHFGAWVAGGLVSRVYTLVTPFAAADLALLKFTQSADTMTICHPSYLPYKLTRTGHAAWTLTPAFLGSSLAAPAIATVIPSLAGDATIYNYVVTAVGANGVTESLPSAPMGSGDSKTMSSTAGAHQTITWTAPAGPAPQFYNIYRQAEVAKGAPVAGQLFGFVGFATGLSFVDSNIAPDFTQTPPQDPGLFVGAGNFPGCTNYFQQRQVFAGSTNNPQTLWASKTGDFYNMQYSSPSRPNDAIVGTIVAKELNAIKHLVSMDAMIALTSRAAWKIDAGSQGGAITPSAIESLAQAYNGCSDVPPLTVNQDILYVQSKGSIVRDLAYNYYVKIYTGSDLTVLSSHLFSGHQILEWAWLEEPFKLILAVREDGALLAFTYLKEQEVMGWSHWDTDGQYKSICSISEGQEDACYVVVSRRIKGQYVQMIERLASRLTGAVPENDVPADFSKFWFVDAGLQYPLTYPQATVTPQATLVTANAYDWWARPRVVAVTVVAGGAGYVAPVATLLDPTGSGAVVTLTVAGGVITAATIAGGDNYTRPTITVTDAAGAGAILHPVVARDVEMDADSPVLANAKVGDLFLVNGGYGYVRLVNSARSVTVDMMQPMGNPYPAAPGAWSCTSPVAAVSGLDYLEGKTVSILADGGVQPQQVVANGTVALQTPASAIVVGLPFVSQLRTLPLDIPSEATVQGKRKSIPALSVRMQDSRGMKVGHSQDAELFEFKERDDNLVMGAPAMSFSGDRRVVIGGKYDTPGQVIVQQDQPLPASVLALLPEVVVGDT